MTGIGDSFGRPVKDESHRVGMSVLSFEAWAQDVSLPAEAPEVFCCPSLRTVDRS